MSDSEAKKVALLWGFVRKNFQDLISKDRSKERYASPNDRKTPKSPLALIMEEPKSPVLASGVRVKDFA